MDVSITVNGVERRHDVEPRLLLVHYLRTVVGLTGTNVGCDTSSCGTCTVLVDGEYEVVDLEIRYLNRVRTGPVLATGEVIPGALDGTCVRVPIIEPTADGRVVSVTSLLCRPVRG